MPTRASITVSVSPNTATAEPTSEPGFDWFVEFTVTVRETAGLAANVDFINFQSGDVTLNFGASELIDAAGTNQISGRGSLAFPLSIFYFTESGDSEFDATVEVQCTDERGNVITAGTDWSVE